MRVPPRVREAQERLAFRLAVRACLEIYYGQSVAESHANADAWWGRISTTSAFKSGYFMHSEPISTAGRIAHEQIVALNERNIKAYERLMDECWKLAQETEVLDAKGVSEAKVGSGVVLEIQTKRPLKASSAKTGRGKLVAAGS